MRASKLTFNIPVYLNMPESAVPAPTGDGSPNTKLSSLTVSAGALSPEFRRDIREYTVIVPNETERITVTASPLNAAQRELMEETGYGGGQWRLLTTLSANPATQNNLTYCYLATGVEPLGEQRLDPTEDLRVHLLTREEVLELLRTDRIRQALMAAPLWRYFGEGNE